MPSEPTGASVVGLSHGAVCASLEDRFHSRMNEAMAAMRKASSATDAKNAESSKATERVQRTPLATRVKQEPPVASRARSDSLPKPVKTEVPVTRSGSAPLASAPRRPEARTVKDTWKPPYDDAREATFERQAEETASTAFWSEQEQQPYWLVPMGREEKSVFERRCGLRVALSRAQATTQKTPLLVDTSAHHVCDSYFTYKHADFVEAKSLFMRERNGTPREELLEELRVKLVNAMRHGLTLYVRMTNTACDFVNKYHGSDTWPIDVFHAPTVAALATLAEEGVNLLESDHPFAAVVRPRDDGCRHGVFVPKPGFEVVVCTYFGVDSFAEFLAGSLPMEHMQPIVPVVAD